MASPAVDYARQNQQRFLNELKDLLRIQQYEKKKKCLLHQYVLL